MTETEFGGDEGKIGTIYVVIRRLDVILGRLLHEVGGLGAQERHGE